MKLKITRRGLAVLALCAALPLTGPFLAGMVRNWRSGDRVLAGLYAVALVVVPFAVSTYVATEGAKYLP